MTNLETKFWLNNLLSLRIKNLAAVTTKTLLVMIRRKAVSTQRHLESTFGETSTHRTMSIQMLLLFPDKEDWVIMKISLQNWQKNKKSKAKCYPLLN